MWWKRRSSPEVATALARVQIFSTLGRRDLERLAAACLLRRYRAGDSILEEGSTGLGMFLITAGRVEVFKTHQGRKVSLAELGNGAVLGEMALLDDQPRSASAVALEDTECLLLSRDRFRTLLKRRPSIAWPIVPPLARRVRDLQDQLLDTGSSPNAAPLRLAERSLSIREDPGKVGVSQIHRDPATADFDLPALGSSHPESPVGASHAEPATDVRRAPYALMITSAVGFGESMRMCEIFMRSLSESSGLANGRPMGDVVRDLPKSLATAGMRSWQHGQSLTSKMFATFRDQLRPGRPGGDRD